MLAVTGVLTAVFDASEDILQFLGATEENVSTANLRKKLIYSPELEQ